MKLATMQTAQQGNIDECIEPNYLFALAELDEDLPLMLGIVTAD